MATVKGEGLHVYTPLAGNRRIIGPVWAEHIDPTQGQITVFGWHIAIRGEFEILIVTTLAS